jgi:hypothetical protein
VLAEENVSLSLNGFLWLGPTCSDLKKKIKALPFQISISIKKSYLRINLIFFIGISD